MSLYVYGFLVDSAALSKAIVDNGLVHFHPDDDKVDKQFAISDAMSRIKTGIIAKPNLPIASLQHVWASETEVVDVFAVPVGFNKANCIKYPKRKQRLERFKKSIAPYARMTDYPRVFALESGPVPPHLRGKMSMPSSVAEFARPYSLTMEEIDANVLKNSQRTTPVPKRLEMEKIADFISSHRAKSGLAPLNQRCRSSHGVPPNKAESNNSPPTAL